MYYKRSTGAVIVRKSSEIPDWVKWVHHAEGKTHCPVCLKLDGCWFHSNIAPQCPHHPNCHCTLEPLEGIDIMSKITVDSAYGKFDPFLFNTSGKYTHGKEKLLKIWGFSVNDIPWLKAEIERQALEKYRSGDYMLGKLDESGQRINIRVAIPRNDTGEIVTFGTGWMARPDGHLQMATPYGDD